MDAWKSGQSTFFQLYFAEVGTGISCILSDAISNRTISWSDPADGTSSIAQLLISVVMSGDEKVKSMTEVAFPVQELYVALSQLLTRSKPLASRICSRCLWFLGVIDQHEWFTFISSANIVLGVNSLFKGSLSIVCAGRQSNRCSSLYILIMCTSLMDSVHTLIYMMAELTIRSFFSVCLRKGLCAVR